MLAVLIKTFKYMSCVICASHLTDMSSAAVSRLSHSREGQASSHLLNLPVASYLLLLSATNYL